MTYFIDVAALVPINLFSMSNLSDKSGVVSDKAVKIKKQDLKLMDLRGGHFLNAEASSSRVLNRASAENLTIS